MLQLIAKRPMHPPPEAPDGDTHKRTVASALVLNHGIVPVLIPVPVRAVRTRAAVLL